MYLTETRSSNINASTNGRNQLSISSTETAHSYQCQNNGHNPRPIYQNREWLLSCSNLYRVSISTSVFSVYMLQVKLQFLCRYLYHMLQVKLQFLCRYLYHMIKAILLSITARCRSLYIPWLTLIMLRIQLKRSFNVE